MAALTPLGAPLPLAALPAEPLPTDPLTLKARPRPVHISDFGENIFVPYKITKNPENILLLSLLSHSFTILKVFKLLSVQPLINPPIYWIFNK